MDVHVMSWRMVIYGDILSHNPPRGLHRPDVILYADNSRMAERISLGFGMEFMLLGIYSELLRFNFLQSVIVPT